MHSNQLKLNALEMLGVIVEVSKGLVNYDDYLRIYTPPPPKL